MPTSLHASVRPTSPQDIARLAALPQVHAAFAWFRSNERELSERQLELTGIPAPPFAEQPRAEWLKQRFLELGLEDVHIDEIGNVIGLRRGTSPAAPLVALTAHIDTVFPAGSNVAARREGTRLFGPGVTDNAAGVTALLALAGALRDTGIRHRASILFVGNVGEEGEGDLRGMRHLFTESRWKDAIAYTLVLDGAATDTITSEALGSRRYEITVRGPGGHSWSDFGVPNPIVALSRALARFGEVPLPADPKTTLNVGVMRGGTSVNSIPESASARVDIRSASRQEIDRVENAMRRLVDEAVRESGSSQNGKGSLAAEIKLIGDRPAAELSPDARILQVILAVDAHLGNASRVRRSSTDANIPIALGREAIALGIGGAGGGAHTLNEWYDPTGRDQGLKRILLALLMLTGVNE
jgi:acetylornithine deacetylase/succinyl-diaminopimelate desuccinylase-like protein